MRVIVIFSAVALLFLFGAFVDTFTDEHTTALLRIIIAMQCISMVDQHCLHTFKS